MRLYLDICCLKRPFDSQEQARVRLEAEAVMTILSIQSDEFVLIRSAAQILENSLNTLRWRREAVDAWLKRGSIEPLPEEPAVRRTSQLIQLGFRTFDAFHLASAELSKADVLLTVDNRMVRKAVTLADRIQTRVANPLAFLQEVSSWPT